MIDQKTPDPWDYLAEFIEGNAVRPPGGQQVGPPRYPLVPSVAKELRGIVEAGKRALAAERAQHQQEIADETAKRVRLAENWSKERQAANAELAQRDETIRQLQDAFARCQEVQQATAETWRIEHDQMAEQIRLLRGAMAADDERLRRAAEQAGILYVSCDTAEALAEQIARLSAEVEEQRSFEILMIKDATRLEAARDEAVSEAAILRAERDAAQQREVEANNYFRMSQSNYDEAMRQLRAAQQQIATLTQELSVSRANHIDANQRNMQSVRELEAAEARCATLQGAVAADEERLRQAAARAGVLFVGCDTADVLADRCATLTAALEQLRDCDWTIGRGDRMDAVRDIARNALSGVPTP